ncbi:MAG: DNA polymerase III subunit delta [Lachnospiraceae bacterium]|nr:DNA polymerase III subunit delta [Lachnospiraceae bacterium]
MPKLKDIIGQDLIRKQIIESITNDRVSGGYILTGEKGSGKEFIASVFAQMLVCENMTGDACGECHSCKQAESHSHPDIKYVVHEKPNSISVDEVREQICDDISLKPYQSSRKIYIVGEADKLTPQAQNALLKSLEEAPDYVVIMLLASNINMMLPTVRSRCITWDLKPVPSDVLKKYLMKELQVPDYRADVAIAFAQGNLGKARDMAASDDFSAMQAAAQSVVKNAREDSIADMIALVRSLSEYKVDAGEFLDMITVWYRDVLLFKATGETDSLVYKDDLSIIRKVARRSSYEGIEEVLGAIVRAKERLKANVTFEVAMELLFAVIQENG